MGSSDGYFPHGESLLREVMRERAVNLLYGQRALMVGALQPVAFIGTTQRTSAHEHPWRRLVRTAEMFDAVFFGDRAAADRALSITQRLHGRVNGTIGVQAGPFGPDTRYDAFDPELMLWVTAPVFDSVRVLYETLVRPLDDDGRERLYQETVRWGELFGMPREAMPAVYRQFEPWWAAKLGGDATLLTDRARAVGLAIATHPPAPAPLRPALRVAGFLILGSLQPIVREKYAIHWRRRDRAAYRAATAAIRSGRLAVPTGVRRGSSAELYQLFERTERAWVRRGRHSFGSAA